MFSYSILVKLECLVITESLTVWTFQISKGVMNLQLRRTLTFRRIGIHQL